MTDIESGIADPKWSTQPGPTLFTRKDKKTLSENHLEAMWIYVSGLMIVFESNPNLAKNVMTRYNWDLFWNHYKENQIDVIRHFSFDRDKDDKIRAWETDLNPLEL